MTELNKWEPQNDWGRITTVEAHTAGEPLRVITGGYPELSGDSILEKRRYAREHLDHLRTALMWEPRGHADMYGCIVTEPVTPDGDLGILFMHNEGYSTMCGHGIIGIVKVVLDTGMMNIEGDHLTMRLDTPAGRVTAQARRVNGQVAEVAFLNVPSYVLALDQTVEVQGIGPVRYDVAFGGAYYAFCSAEEIGVGLTEKDFRQLIDLGIRIKKAVVEAFPVEHPFEPDLGFLYGTIFVGAAHNEENHSRNVCVFADGEVDRCPTGTGISARAAIHHTRGELGLNEPFVVESILGTCFTGEVMEVTEFGPYVAVIPEITGKAHITGRSEFFIDPDDMLKNGFLLR